MGHPVDGNDQPQTLDKKLTFVTECQNVEEGSKKGSGPTVLFNWNFNQLGALSKCFTTVKTTSY